MSRDGNAKADEIQTIVHRGEAAEQRLREFGVSSEPLVRAARAAELSRDACTPRHALNQPGSRAWGDGNESLATDLEPEGFQLRMIKNVPVLFHPNGQDAITMVAGDQRTGTDSPPSTKNSRGPGASRMIDFGLDLFVGTEFELKPADRGEYDLWLLLWHRRGELIRCELSLPWGVEGGRIVAWRERILLEPFPYLSDPSAASPPDGPEVDVPVTRRAG